MLLSGEQYEYSKQPGGKVEVINSASAAFRNFVKEKSLYLKGLDPFASIRTQGNSMVDAARQKI